MPFDWLTQMDMDGDGVCEIVNSSPNFPAIYYKRGGQLYGVDLKSVITAAWPELNWWDYIRRSRQPFGPLLRLVCGRRSRRWGQLHALSLLRR